MADFYRPSQPCRPDQSCFRQRLASGGHSSSKRPARRFSGGGGAADGAAGWRWRSMRSAVPGILRDRPPVRFGSSLTSADTYLPACCHVSVRAKHGPQRAHQLSPSPDHLPSPYPGSSSRLRFICSSQTHDRQAAALTSYKSRHIPPGQAADGGCPTWSLSGRGGRRLAAAVRLDERPVVRRRG